MLLIASTVYSFGASLSYIDGAGNSSLGVNIQGVASAGVPSSKLNAGTSLNNSAPNATSFSPIINDYNVYAPNIVRNGSVWNLYYGGFVGSSRNDKIYLAVSQGADITSGYNPSTTFVCIDNGVYDNVNDPSVVKNGSNWIMAYSAAAAGQLGFTDKIAYAYSTNGANFTPSTGNTNYEVVINENSGSPKLGGRTLRTNARPALVYRSGTWYMWFDGWTSTTANSPIPTSPNDSNWVYWSFHQFLATTTQSPPTAGSNPATDKWIFTLQKNWSPSDSGYMSEADIKLDAYGNFVATYVKSRDRVLINTSTDGINWGTEKTVVDYTHYGVAKRYLHNPGLVIDSDSSFWGVLYSCSDGTDLGQAKFYMAYNLMKVELRCTTPSSTVAVYGVAGKKGEYIVNSFGYSGFSWIKITDPLTNNVLYDQPFTGAPGSRWLFTP